MSKIITLTNSDELTIVDDIDYDYLIQWNWQLGDTGHSKRIQRTTLINKIITTIYMSKEITIRMDLNLTNQIDHIDRDIFNNQRFNLRAATRSQNKANNNLYKNNTTGYKDVHFHNLHQKYCARISINNKRIQLGYFEDAEDAAKAYDKAAIKYFGQFASLNFPERKYE